MGRHQGFHYWHNPKTGPGRCRATPEALFGLTIKVGAGCVLRVCRCNCLLITAFSQGGRDKIHRVEINNAQGILKKTIIKF